MWPFEGVDEEIHTLFDWRPSVLGEAISGSPSHAPDLQNVSVYCGIVQSDERELRCVPNFYDQHLASQLRLKHIVLCKDLHRKLAFHATQRFKEQRKSGLEKNIAQGVFVSRVDRTKECGLLTPAQTAADVRQHYARTTARFCLPVASTLAFHPNRWSSILEWSGCQPQEKLAMCAASLKFTTRIDPRCAGNNFDVNFLSLLNLDDTCAVLNMTTMFSDIATWDCRSPSDNNRNAMVALREELANKGELHLTEDINESRPMESSARTGDRQLLDFHGTSEWLRESPGSPFDNLSSQNMIGRSDCPPDLLQQGLLLLHDTWAQSVRHNSTFLVLTEGTRELIGLRLRDAQTLYVSDLLVPSATSKPGYGSVQVGLYLAAIQDAKERLRLMQEQSEDKGQAMGVSGDGNILTGKDAVSRNDRLAFRPTRVAEPHLLPHEALLVTMSYEIYESVAPSIFVRGRLAHNISQLSEDDRRPFISDDAALRVVLLSQIARGVTGIVHEGRLEADVLGAQMRFPVVAKLAFTRSQKVQMDQEFAVYQKLGKPHKKLGKRAIRGVPLCFGLFQSIDEGGPACMLLSHAGVSLADRQEPLTDEEKEQFLATLDEIHSVGMLHNDICRPANLMIDGAGRPIIVDFGFAKLKVSKAIRRRERRQLESLLSKLQKGKSAFRASTQSVGYNSEDNGSVIMSDASGYSYASVRSWRRSESASGPRFVEEETVGEWRRQCSDVPSSLRRNPSRSVRRGEEASMPSDTEESSPGSGAIRLARAALGSVREREVSEKLASCTQFLVR